MSEREIRLNIPISPADICTAQQKGERIVGGKWIQHYTKPEVKRSKAIIRHEILNQLLEEGISCVRKFKRIDGLLKPIDCLRDPLSSGDTPVMLCLHYVYRNSTLPKRDEGKHPYRVKRPDLDNLTKSVMDCLTDMEFWADDSCVAKLFVSKVENRYAEGRIELIAKTLPKYADTDTLL